MGNMVVFIIFMVILGYAINIAFTTYLNQRKGRDFKEGLLWGLIPIIGIIFIAMLPATDVNIVNEMYERNMIDLDELNKTKEVLLTKEINLKNKNAK